MEAEFDKEMDALLRKAAGSGVLFGDDARSHLDADTIAAFAENALPLKSRTIYTQHLAACDPCRISLANMISMNAGAETSMAAAAAPVPAVSVPWYRRLFLASNLAYVMGGLVLVFGGLFGFIVLQNSYKGETVAVSQLNEPTAPENAPARAEAANSLYSANAASNTATNVPGEIPRGFGVSEEQLIANSNSAPVPPPPSTAASSDTATAAPVKNLTVDGIDRDKVAAAQPLAKEAPKREDDAKEKNEVKLAAAEQEARKQDANAGNIFSQQQNQMMPNTSKKSTGPSRNAIQRDNRAYDSRQAENLPAQGRSVASPGSAMKDGSSASARSVGGRSFELKQGAWYDTAYSGQKTKNVRRSSDDYRKLDSGLRNIAETLGGTVVVVWGGKAYRIQ